MFTTIRHYPKLLSSLNLCCHSDSALLWCLLVSPPLSLCPFLPQPLMLVPVKLFPDLCKDMLLLLPLSEVGTQNALFLLLLPLTSNHLLSFVDSILSLGHENSNDMAFSPLSSEKLIIASTTSLL
ncbi:hypothetical protein RJT34_02206 [Clitoria ternatea]|uniref:Uncharacterized protein n=1 Tax=Clitoria ternatea TaxID=43366 RepID=A0AAN9PYW2_CLITE